ncbi:general stress protein [Catenuloplanes sp. NPDC051500]|uniref:general stress protein n=1 Tax=Catenuloplanes sp. NPDC051500 TaxID=3363959 RepID=UPI003789172D
MSVSDSGTPIPPGPTGDVPAAPPADLTETGTSVTVASYPDYQSAQRAVDYLSDNQFPVEKTAIIGTDLRLVENVLGRLTIARAALAGLASGAYFGFFIGLLLGIFTDGGWLGIMLSAIVIGGIWGAIFGALAHALTGGRRDFTSRSTLQAGQYAVTATPDVAEQGRQLLVRLNWQASGAA